MVTTGRTSCKRPVPSATPVTNVPRHVTLSGRDIAGRPPKALEPRWTRRSHSHSSARFLDRLSAHGVGSWPRWKCTCQATWRVHEASRGFTGHRGASKSFAELRRASRQEWRAEGSLCACASALGGRNRVSSRGEASERPRPGCIWRFGGGGGGGLTKALRPNPSASPSASPTSHGRNPGPGMGAAMTPPAHTDTSVEPLRRRALRVWLCLSLHASRHSPKRRDKGQLCITGAFRWAQMPPLSIHRVMPLQIDGALLRNTQTMAPFLPTPFGCDPQTTSPNPHPRRANLDEVRPSWAKIHLSTACPSKQYRSDTTVSHRFNRAGPPPRGGASRHSSDIRSMCTIAAKQLVFPREGSVDT